ncbi:MAG: glycosyltransferase [bacterium]
MAEKKDIRVSIIVPVKKVNDYIFESIPKLLQIKRDDFEIIIFTDEEDREHTWTKTKIIPSGVVGPAEKRDLALQYARGEILAFLDDDAYPEAGWLENALENFDDKSVGAVGGPAVTPQDDGVLEKASGAVFESFLGGGTARNRYLPMGTRKQVDDWPTVNFLIRKDVFKQVGGFNSAYWPGEDTKLCLDIINAGYTIIYDPNSIVYHHRRKDILKHLKQIGNYAIHRGYFAKRYPKNSYKLPYFVPSAFAVYLLLLVASLFIFPGSYVLIFSIPLFVYIVGLVMDAIIIGIRWKNLAVALAVMPLIFLTHIWYGVRFIQGLVFTKKLKSELRK